MPPKPRPPKVSKKIIDSIIKNIRTPRNRGISGRATAAATGNRISTRVNPDVPVTTPSPEGKVPVRPPRAPFRRPPPSRPPGRPRVRFNDAPPATPPKVPPRPTVAGEAKVIGEVHGTPIYDITTPEGMAAAQAIDAEVALQDTIDRTGVGYPTLAETTYLETDLNQTAEQAGSVLSHGAQVERKITQATTPRPVGNIVDAINEEKVNIARGVEQFDPSAEGVPAFNTPGHPVNTPQSLASEPGSLYGDVTPSDIKSNIGSSTGVSPVTPGSTTSSIPGLSPAQSTPYTPNQPVGGSAAGGNYTGGASIYDTASNASDFKNGVPPPPKPLPPVNRTLFDTPETKLPPSHYTPHPVSVNEGPTLNTALDYTDLDELSGITEDVPDILNYIDDIGDPDVLEFKNPLGDVEPTIEEVIKRFRDNYGGAHATHPTHAAVADALDGSMNTLQPVYPDNGTGLGTYGTHTNIHETKIPGGVTPLPKPNAVKAAGLEELLDVDVGADGKFLPPGSEEPSLAQINELLDNSTADLGAVQNFIRDRLGNGALEAYQSARAAGQTVIDTAQWAASSEVGQGLEHFLSLGGFGTAVYQDLLRGGTAAATTVAAGLGASAGATALLGAGVGIMLGVGATWGASKIADMAGVPRGLTITAGIVGTLLGVPAPVAMITTTAAYWVVGKIAGGIYSKAKELYRGWVEKRERRKYEERELALFAKSVAEAQVAVAQEKANQAVSVNPWEFSAEAKQVNQQPNRVNYDPIHKKYLRPGVVPNPGAPGAPNTNPPNNDPLSGIPQSNSELTGITLPSNTIKALEASRTALLSKRYANLVYNPDVKEKPNFDYAPEFSNWEFNNDKQLLHYEPPHKYLPVPITTPGAFRGYIKEAMFSSLNDPKYKQLVEPMKVPEATIKYDLKAGGDSMRNIVARNIPSHKGYTPEISANLLPAYLMTSSGLPRPLMDASAMKHSDKYTRFMSESKIGSERTPANLFKLEPRKALRGRNMIQDLIQDDTNIRSFVTRMIADRRSNEQFMLDELDSEYVKRSLDVPSSERFAKRFRTELLDTIAHIPAPEPSCTSGDGEISKVQKPDSVPRLQVR